MNMPREMAACTMERATPADAGNISRLMHGLASSFLLNPSGQGAEGFKSRISAEAIGRFILAPNFSYFKATIGGDLAGVVAVRDQSHLYHLFVADHFQKRGLARALWTHARDAAVAAGNPGFFTVNSTPVAVPVYEKFGFQIQGPRVETMGIAYVPMRLEMAGRP